MLMHVLYDQYDKSVMLDCHSEQVRHGLVMLSQRILGPNTIIQGAVKTILTSTPQQFFDNSLSLVQVYYRHGVY